MSKLVQPNRESVTTINRDGSRKFLHPADVSGVFTHWRRIFALLLIGIYVTLPWIPINGNPAVFLDVFNRRFHLFGLTFAAQDLWLAFFFITGVGFSLFFITALFGRLWCGWACPQTVFLEHVYRRIERWIEGDSNKRKKLDDQPWTAEKIKKRGLKQLIFAVISLMIAHLFLAYFISIPQLYQWMQDSPKEHWGAFLFVFIASALIYFNFAWFREQLCLVICPYGRLQSAMIDDDSVIIGYDEIRGEPRGKAKQSGIGDCVDCTRCVQVCPTGIDIRQGLQIECVGCANCIDACDTIMTKLNRPTGLIRYDSQNGLAGKKKRILRPRIAIYFVLMLIGATAMTLSVLQLRSANMNVVRMTGSPYYITDTAVRNQYMLRAINKTSETKTYTVASLAEGQTYEMEGNEDGITVEPMGEVVRPVIITVLKENYQGRFPIEFTLVAPDGHDILTREAEFIGPNPTMLKKQSEAAASAK
ncbi:MULTISPECIES: cytochrome c oxidase accessory protein CcoG [unclassified Lentimonas]|uniref:cytochrome c oxidase accessory protein CcoG n=1 Tax=unclassified Lentimonas TaxID=2630993 RepID=UPI00132533EA|nr:MULTISPECIES: cytochrome c oxidase accessory protein CcoG [unclassified Lentimonas]CAA6679116.1 Type cbb3 cytochrome oxidase biogenesis protein CcoG, involved in Cu oxidation [Lentimonas sp. CC4]CAA6684140.1 Type cbb3 cytochrome oxidase biogenesis protein CcoG, involved in Cu oxidation [Lentimonas sp. CC6]CAA7076484.1 Type cbb3 cytochrome oxidase biogenesis protein CcoG, involved in Cu oxidation [Lentimonas sp. CC4]CAA7170420.1 Type cbb3 cytochrome oxidase biogenesis protein CcoG, involved i